MGRDSSAFYSWIKASSCHWQHWILIVYLYRKKTSKEVECMLNYAQILFHISENFPQAFFFFSISFFSLFLYWCHRLLCNECTQIFGKKRHKEYCTILRTLEEFLQGELWIVIPIYFECSHQNFQCKEREVTRKKNNAERY